MTESLFRIVLAIIMALAVALAPRPEPRHDGPEPSAMPGASVAVSWGATGNHVEVRTWAPTTKPEERGRARATTTAGPVRRTSTPVHSAAPTHPQRVGVVTAPARTLTGPISWYCLPGRSACTTGFPASGMYAAAGPLLRVGNWRGRLVTISTRRASVQVRLVDECQCPNGRLADLYASAFSGLGPLSAGLLDVTVTE